MIDQSGPALAHVSLSARQAEQAGLLTSGTYGRTGTGSSNSAALQSSLANRLRAKTASVGSILYRLTWKDRATPSGRLICALRASAWSGKLPKAGNGYAGPFTIALIPSFDPCFAILPIGLAKEISERAETIFASDSILSGWPTPMAGTPAQNGNNPAGNTDSSRQTVALLSGWPTPDAGAFGTNDANWEARRAECKERHGNNGFGLTVGMAATLSGWTTTTTRDHKDTPGMTAQRDGKDRADQLPRQAYLSGWSTPTAVEPRRSPETIAKLAKKRLEEHGQTTVPLYRNEQAVLSGWPTPMAKIAGPDFATANRPNTGSPLLPAVAAMANGPMRLTADGTLKTGCSAGMTGGGQLNPAHSRWLMMLPPAWENYAPLATRSTRKRRPGSAKS